MVDSHLPANLLTSLIHHVKLKVLAPELVHLSAKWRSSIEQRCRLA